MLIKKVSSKRELTFLTCKTRNRKRAIAIHKELKKVNKEKKIYLG